MARVRKDIASLGAGWSPELEWYAKAVRALQALPPNDRTSWRYLGAMHGFVRQRWQDLNIIQPGDPLPPRAEWDGRMWNQCQHQGWWFLPWHRGYLWAFEDIVAAKVAELGGGNDWALPYWNYLDNGNPNARDWPAPFVDATLPDGSSNPLSAVRRDGISPLGPQPDFPNLEISLDAVTKVHFFTSGTGGLGLGGGRTVFNQFGGKTGALEGDPHNAVHVMVGGADGLMSDPYLAGLDPIFWIHHCNIDRLWAAWLARAGNVQENGAAWGTGPAPRRFEIPDATGNLVVFHPAETLPGARLAPSYDDITAGTGLGALPADVGEEPGDMNATLSSEGAPDATLMGANGEAVTITDAPVATTVAFDPEQTGIANADEEQRVLLNLEHVRGSTPSGVLTISIRPKRPGAEPAANVPPVVVKSVALFGLEIASDPASTHGGSGISMAVDVTDLLKRLGQEAGAPLEELEVRLEQPGTRTRPITVERVSFYRQAAR
ncbi:MAG: tyrosinase domain protein [Bradyrhizobium sp.]|nr:tyrosinase domain protein [Bradyrhizobium sp.]